MRIVCILLLVATTGLVACCSTTTGNGGGSGPAPVGPRVIGHFGQAVVDTVQAPDRVDVYRLDPALGEPAGDGEAVAGNATIQAHVATPGSDWSDRLVTLLLDDDSYDWQRAKDCEPRSGVLVRFHRKEQKVDASFCFECAMLSLAPPGAQSWEDFDPIETELITLMQKAFPDDEQIQALGQRR